MDGRTDDGQKVITIAHPEHSSGELKITDLLSAELAQRVMVKMLPASILI